MGEEGGELVVAKGKRGTEEEAGCARPGGRGGT